MKVWKNARTRPFMIQRETILLFFLSTLYLSTTLRGTTPTKFGIMKKGNEIRHLKALKLQNVTLSEYNTPLSARILKDSLFTGFPAFLGEKAHRPGLAKTLSSLLALLQYPPVSG